jgi:hypothetical protein
MKRSHAVWLGSFAIIATTLYFGFHVPPLPIVLGGVLAFIITASIGFFRKK